MALGGVEQADRPGGSATGGGRVLVRRSPLRQRVATSPLSNPARRLATRATAIGAAALVVGWLLGPEDGLVPVLVLAALGLILGIRWARTVWDRRTVGRRIQRLTGQVPTTLGAWMVAGSGYWLRPTAEEVAPLPAAVLHVAGLGSAQPNGVAVHSGAPTGPTLPSGFAAPSAFGADWTRPRAAPSAMPIDPVRPSGLSTVFGPGMLPPPPPRSVPSGPPMSTAPLSWPAPPPVLWSSPPTASALTPGGWVPVSTNPPWVTTPGVSGWRPANSGVGPFATGEDVELLVTPGAIWVVGRMVERYVRRDASVEPVGTDGVAITSGDGSIRRWITLVPDVAGDLDWVVDLLAPPAASGAGEVTEAQDPGPADAPPAASAPHADAGRPRGAWDDPRRSIIDDGRR